MAFAGGAMAWVACAELLVEAVADAGYRITCLCMLVSLGTMLLLQAAIAEETNGNNR